MNTIPPAIKTLLKSKCIIGSDSPAYQIDVQGGDQYSDATWQPANDVRSQVTFDYGCPSFAERSDGKILCTYYSKDQNKIFLSYVDNPDDIYDTNNCMVTNEWDFSATFAVNAGSYTTGSGLNSRSKLFTTASGTLILVCYDPGYHNAGTKCKVYSSVNGLGTDFSLIGTAWDDVSPAKISSFTTVLTDIGSIHQLSSGRICFMCGKGKAGSGGFSLFWIYGYYFCYSDDDGVNWTVKEVDWIGTNSYSYIPKINGIGVANNCIFTVTGCGIATGTWEGRISYSIDEGENWSNCTGYTQIGGELATSIPCGVYSDQRNTYLLHNDELAQPQGYLYYINQETNLPLTLQEPYNRTTLWEKYTTDSFSDITSSCIEELELDRPWFLFCYCIYAGDDDAMVIVATRDFLSLNLYVKSINISRQITANAQRCSIVTPNVDPDDFTKLGHYSPESDVTASWENILKPGCDIIVNMGYGTDQTQVFHGEIDETNIDRDPRDANISINLRDDAWKILDKTINDGSDNYFITYSNKTIEYIVNDALTKAGFTSITTESTGITVTSKTFDRVKYADIIEWCITISGYELLIDETGAASFHRPTDRQPEKLDDDVELNAEVPVNLELYPIVEDSIVVYSAANKSGTLYELDVDYEITSGDDQTAWQINRLATGSIGDGDTVYVSYIYAAWVFREGEDIFILGYKYSRLDVYAKIIVTGKDENNDATQGLYELPSPSNYGVDEDKIMFIDDSDLDTDAKCQDTADQLAADMLKRYREVTYAAIGIPWLQCGDCVQIIETSSGISEIYRILSYNLTLDPSGMFMTFKAYHYGYSAAST